MVKCFYWGWEDYAEYVWVMFQTLINFITHFCGWLKYPVYIQLIVDCRLCNLLVTYAWHSLFAEALGMINNPLFVIIKTKVSGMHSAFVTIKCTNWIPMIWFICRLYISTDCGWLGILYTFSGFVTITLTNTYGFLFNI